MLIEEWKKNSLFKSICLSFCCFFVEHPLQTETVY